jgi:uncharacterized protein YceK
MKRFLCIVLTVMFVVTSCISVTYADSKGKPNGKSWKKYFGKYDFKDCTLEDFDFDEDYMKGFKNSKEYQKFIKEMFKEFRKDRERREKLLKEIAKLKKKFGEHYFNIIVNGQDVECDNPPVIKEGRVLIPVKPITKALGAKLDWDPDTRTATIKKDDTVVEIIVNKNGDGYTIKVDGVKIDLEEKPQIINNSMMLPVSLIMKIFNKNVEVDEDSGTIIIDDEIMVVNDNTIGKVNNTFEYSGNWKHEKNVSNAYLKDVHWSDDEDDYFKVRFEGTKIRLYGIKGPDQGIASIYIDGQLKEEIDCYSSTRKSNRLLYASTKLTNEAHVLKVVVAGKKNRSASDCRISVDRVEIEEIIENPNLALKKTVVSSSNSKEGSITYSADKAVDGDKTTRWSSKYNDDEWIYVDLGAKYKVGRVRLNWEAAYAKEYKIQVSNDASNWSDVYETKSGGGGIDNIVLKSTVTARYVRVLGVDRATKWGYSLWEFEVYKQ